MDANTQQRRKALLDNGPRIVMYAAAVFGCVIVALLTVRYGIAAGIAFGVAPLVLLALFSLLANPYWAMMLLFTANYFVMGLIRYTHIMPGVVMDGIIGVTVISLMFQACVGRVDVSRAFNGLTAAAGVWLLYCVLELFSIEGASPKAWLTSARGVAIYFFIITLLVPMVFGRVKDLYRIMVLWGVFTLAAVLKAYIQKRFGFDPWEMRWLYLRGGGSTHLISSGARYFSIYSDAANFGAGMGFAMVTFSICALYVRKLWARIFFGFVAVVACYGMLISGTRGAMAVPFAGYALFLLLSRNWKVILIMTVGLVGAWLFFTQTHLMHGNIYVRRMRSAFNPDDPSLVVRLENQAMMRQYLKTRPFGVGIGMGGTKAQQYDPSRYMSQIATDSWFVMLWVETGIVGLSLYVTILIYLLIKCSVIIMFRIKDRALRNILAAMLSGIFGIMVASMGNEILGQFPTGFIVYTLLAFIVMGPHLDRQLAEGSNPQTAGDEN